MESPLILASLVRSFSLVPAQAHGAVLLRHAHRPAFPPGSSGYGHEVELSPEGVQAAEALGRLFSARRPGLLLTSPVQRCVTTLRALLRGTGWTASFAENARLANPGCFVADPDIAVPLSLELGVFELVRRQLCEQEPLPGMRSTPEGVTLLIDLFTSHHGEAGTLDVFVTHDATLAPTVGYLMGTTLGVNEWPDFLEGMFFWRSSRGLAGAWRGELREWSWPTSQTGKHGV